MNNWSKSSKVNKPFAYFVVSKILEMNKEEITKNAEAFAKERMKNYDSGHDWFHIERVRRTAAYINSLEQIADPFLLDLAAILHDAADLKFLKTEPEKAYESITELLNENGLADSCKRLIEAIRNVSFSNKKRSGDLNDPVLHVLQDADRLDAIGAIGVARAFNYGGFRNNAIYIPLDFKGISQPSTIGHFYDKLLKLKDLMNTPTGKKMAEERHAFLESFLQQFYSEWETGIKKR